MNAKRVKNSTKILVFVTYIAMIAANALANILPINGLNTGEVSDSYPNLFAPAGMTFAIWGVIYALLAAYALYQAGLFNGKKEVLKGDLLNKVGFIFSISSLLNTVWIFAWHYKIVPLSLALISMMLLCLIVINKAIDREKLSGKEYFFIHLPFSIYFGWVTVATIANATTFFVSINWKGFGVSEVTWTVIILIVGLLIGAATMVRNRNMTYGLVLIWAYYGIWTKHVSPSGFASRYPSIIMTLLVCLFIFALTELYVIFKARKSVV